MFYLDIRKLLSKNLYSWVPKRILANVAHSKQAHIVIHSFIQTVTRSLSSIKYISEMNSMAALREFAMELQS